MLPCNTLKVSLSSRKHAKRTSILRFPAKISSSSQTKGLMHGLVQKILDTCERVAKIFLHPGANYTYMYNLHIVCKSAHVNGALDPEDSTNEMQWLHVSNSGGSRRHPCVLLHVTRREIRTRIRIISVIMVIDQNYKRNVQILYEFTSVGTTTHVVIHGPSLRSLDLRNKNEKLCIIA